MIVAVPVQVVPTVKEFLYFKFVLFRVADLVVDDASTINNDLVIEGTVLNVDFLSVTEQIVDLVHIDTIARI